MVSVDRTWYRSVDHKCISKNQTRALRVLETNLPPDLRLTPSRMSLKTCSAQVKGLRAHRGSTVCIRRNALHYCCGRYWYVCSHRVGVADHCPLDGSLRDLDTVQRAAIAVEQHPHAVLQQCSAQRATAVPTTTATIRHKETKKHRGQERAGKKHQNMTHAICRTKTVGSSFAHKSIKPRL